MSIIIVNGSLDDRCDKSYTYIEFVTKSDVTNIEEINWSIHTYFLLRGEPLKYFSNLLNRCSSIIVIQGGEGCKDSECHFLTIPE